jgi:hypothetical protein
MPRLAFSDWTAEQLRCTAFTLPGAPSTAAHWWKLLADADPEQVTSNPRLGSSQAVGTFGSRPLIVSTQSDRIELFLGPLPIDAASVQGQAATEPAPPSIGGAVEAFDVFSKLSNRWLAFEDIPGVSRLALGGVFTHQEGDKRTSYLRLPDYLPVQIDPESSDFMFQINLPTQSRSGPKGLVINRLSKWAVTMFKLVSLNVSSGSFAHELNTTIALRTEIDINTAQEFQGELPKDRLIEIFSELIEQGRSLITNGVLQQ